MRRRGEREKERAREKGTRRRRRRQAHSLERRRRRRKKKKKLPPPSSSLPGNDGDPNQGAPFLRGALRPGTDHRLPGARGRQGEAGLGARGGAETVRKKERRRFFSSSSFDLDERKKKTHSLQKKKSFLPASTASTPTGTPPSSEATARP